MPVHEHVVSYRNGPQVMVKGLKLSQLGYRRGARVIVSDAAAFDRERWCFVVANDEHATLVSRNPAPPDWIQKGVRIRIEILDSGSDLPGEPREAKQHSVDTVVDVGEATVQVTDTDLAEWRRSILRMLDAAEGGPSSIAKEGVAARINRLTYQQRIPREIAALMRAVTEMRNREEYRPSVLTRAESTAVRAAWQAVAEWFHTRK
jgi:hypothetical protein